MQRKRYDVRVKEEMELNMTPMIDIVFLLIIFFMCVTELSKLDSIAAVQLPVADQAYVDQDSPDKIVINIEKTKNNKAIIYFMNKPVTWEGLERLLHIAAARKPEGPPLGPNQPPPSSQKIMIRADRELRYRIVQDVLMSCAKQGLYKVSLVAKPVERK